MKKIKKIVFVLLAVFILTGCTKYKTIEKQPITITETGQRVVDNILCKTEDTTNQYKKLEDNQQKLLEEKLQKQELSQEDYDKKLEEIRKSFNIENVVNCSEFNILSGENGLWETVFVKPLTWLLLTIGSFTKKYGWAIAIVTILIRLVLYPLTKKTAMQSENMKAAKSKLNKLEEKYRNRTDKDAQMMKSQEMMKIYKDFNINPMSGCLFALIQIPLFFAFYEALYRLPVIFEENFFGLNLGLTPWTALSTGKWYYLIFVVLVSLATYFSFKLNATAAPMGDQQKQMKMMTNFSVIMISVTSFTMSTGIALYWIVNSSFTIIQNVLVKRRKKNDNIA